MLKKKQAYETEKVFLEEADPSRRHVRHQHLRTALVRSAASFAAVLAGGVAWMDCFGGSAAVLFCIIAAITALGLHLLDISEYHAETNDTAAFADSIKQWVSLGLLLAAVVLATLVPPFSTGMQDILNQTIYNFDEAFDAYLPLLSSAGTPAFNMAVIPLGVLAGLLYWVLVKRNMALMWTVCLGLVLGGCIWLFPNHAVSCLLCTTVAWMAGWSLCVRHVIPSNKNLLGILLRALAAAAVACCIAFVYSPAAVVTQVYEGLIDAIDTVRYGSDTLPEGDVAHSTDMNDGAESRISITFEQTPEESTYLRGFVGADYQDATATWTALDHTAYEDDWQGLFTWLSGKGFTTPTQYATCMSINEQLTGQPVSEWWATISVTGANRRYVYTPSTESDLNGTGTIEGRDGSRLSSGLLGSANYSFEALAGSVDLDVTPTWLEEETSLEAGQNYLDAESVYRAFVEENYLYVSDEDRALIEELFYNDDTWNPTDEPTTYSVVSRVRIMLSTLASYSESPVSYTGQDEGFINWFLTDAREGNSAYFSTAAVEALRVQGIPARYVEGYLISADELEQMSASGQTQAELTAQNAHAWVEIYLDGEGWVPVDVTPGFYTQPFTAQNVIPVNQETSSGDSDEAGQDGAVMGDMPEQPDDQAEQENLAPWQIALVFVGLILLVILISVAVLEIRRRVLLARLAERLASDEQAVAIRANYDLFALLMLASGVKFDPKRPLESTAGAAQAFKTVRPEEYRRAIHLYQKAVFGETALQPYEMRTLERFNMRLEAEMPAATGIHDKLRRRYRYLR